MAKNVSKNKKDIIKLNILINLTKNYNKKYITVAHATHKLQCIQSQKLNIVCNCFQGGYFKFVQGKM